MFKWHGADCPPKVDQSVIGWFPPDTPNKKGYKKSCRRRR